MEVRISIEAFEIVCFNGEDKLEVKGEINQRKEPKIRSVRNYNFLVF